MWDYAGLIRSETLLEAGQRALLRLKEKAENSMIARNPHELMRCLEVFNMIEIGELVFMTAKERKGDKREAHKSRLSFYQPIIRKVAYREEDGEGTRARVEVSKEIKDAACDR